MVLLGSQTQVHREPSRSYHSIAMMLRTITSDEKRSTIEESIILPPVYHMAKTTLQTNRHSTHGLIDTLQTLR